VTSSCHSSLLVTLQGKVRESLINRQNLNIVFYQSGPKMDNFIFLYKIPCIMGAKIAIFMSWANISETHAGIALTKPLRLLFPACPLSRTPI
jgi:hypothetical protein